MLRAITSMIGLLLVKKIGPGGADCANDYVMTGKKWCAAWITCNNI
jgi:hypothetical protein